MKVTLEVVDVDGEVEGHAVYILSVSVGDATFAAAYWTDGSSRVLTLPPESLPALGMGDRNEEPAYSQLLAMANKLFEDGNN